jgi:hypothetical protein
MEHKNDMILRLQLGEKMITIGGASSPYRLLSSGFVGGEATEAVTETAHRAQPEGALVLNRYPAGRELTLLFEIADYDNREAYRSSLLSFFDPTAEGVLTVTRVGTDGRSVSRSIACMLSGRMTMTQENLHSYIRVRVPLYCPDPYFFSDTAESAAAHDVTDLLSFPLTVTADTGAVSGLVQNEDVLRVWNSGDAPTGFMICLRAVDYGGTQTAATVNPVITREEDGAYIRILTTLEVGDTLVISTLPGAKYVLKNEENCLRFDRGSTFFPLLCGQNTLHISADAMPEPPDTMIAYRNRYFGA